MPTLQITDRGLKSLRTTRQRETFWDAILPGFGVRASSSGGRVFVLRYRVNGSRPQVTLGAYPALSLADARAKARELLERVGKGESPAGDQSFNELADLYLERHAKTRKRSWYEDERQIKKDLRPSWGSRKARDIRRADVHELLDRVVDRGSPIQANRTRALISKIFNFAISRGIVENNPATHVPAPAKPRSRQRVLSESEIRELWATFDGLGRHVAASLRLRLLTAQRGIEVMAMRWEDLEGEWWTIPPEVAKNGLAHRVPLSPAALAILASVGSDRPARGWVFPSVRSGHLRWVQKAVSQVREATSFDWTPHDLRRTAATYMTSMGFPRLVIAKILNHADTGVTAVYDRSSYDIEKRQALAAWGARVESIVRGEEKQDKVIGRIG